MQIWVDADACPQAIKELLFRAAARAQVVTTLVANTLVRTPSSPFIRTIRVPKGFDGADHRIVQEMQPGDLVVTADIPWPPRSSNAEATRSTPAASSTPRTTSGSGWPSGT